MATNQTSSKHKGRHVPWIIYGFVVFLIVAILLWRNLGGSASSGGTDIARLGGAVEGIDRSDALGGAKSTPDLSSRLEAQNKRDAEVAISHGESTFPVMTPNEILSSEPDVVQATQPTVTVPKKVEQMNTSQVEYRPRKETPPPTTPSSRARSAQDNRIRIQAMIDAMRDAKSEMKLKPGNMISVKTTLPKAAQPSSQEPSDLASKTQGQIEEDDALTALLVPGSVFYTVNEYEVNSDYPNKDVVLYVEHPLEFQGARFFGQFSRSDELMTVELTRLVHEGKEYSLRGLAINPEDAKPDVASDVDTHFLERWGALMAATFIEGLGNAITQSNSRTTVSNGTVVQGSDSYSATEIALEGAGKVGQKAANQIEKGFDRAPTVRMHPGAEVAVVIMKSSERSK